MKRKRTGESAVPKPKINRRKRTSAFWAALPLPSLVQVFQYLSDEDRVSCSQVCKHWKRAFDSPCLWRRRTFEFGGHKGQMLGQTAIQFFTILGKHLRYVTITCRHLTSNTCVIITNCLVPSLEALSQACLHELIIDDLEQDRFWRYSYLRNTVTDSLCRFLQTQNKLKILQITNSQFSRPAGIEILESIGQTSGPSIEKLLLENYFHSRLAVFEHERYLSTMQLFPSLTHMALNYCCLNEQLLHHWSTNLQGKLKHISIRANDNEPFDHVISREAWAALVTSCPDLAVSLSILGIGQLPNVIPILATSLPLVDLRFWSGYDNNTEFQLSDILSHVTNNFQTSLERLDLEFDNFHDDLDDALVTIIARCCNLKVIRIKVNTNVEVAATICDILRERQSTLVSVDITLCDISDQEMEGLQALRERLQTMAQQQGVQFMLHDNLFN